MPKLVTDLLKEKHHPCPDCGKSYLRRKSLYNHRRYECGQIGQFTCTVCNYRAKQKVHLKTHYFTKHSMFSKKIF